MAHHRDTEDTEDKDFFPGRDLPSLKLWQGKDDGQGKETLPAA